MPRTFLFAVAFVLIAGLSTLVAPTFASVLAGAGDLARFATMDWMQQAAHLALGA